jgi:hypothetical protein
MKFRKKYRTPLILSLLLEQWTILLGDIMAKTMTIVLVLLTAIVAGGFVYLLKPSTQVHTSITVEQIKAIAKLGTAEYTVSAVRDQGFKSRGIIGYSDWVVVICRGKVTGSVNMEKVTVDVKEAADERHVSIHFGPGSVEVSGVEFDPNDAEPERVISAHEKMGNILGKPANAEQRTGMTNEARKDIRKAAIEAGIVKRTMENAEIALSAFISSFGYRATITFDEKAYDPSAS